MNTASLVTTVREVLNRNPVSVDGMATVQEALQLMRDNDVSALVVMRRNEQDEHGLVLLTDIARHIVSQDRSLTRTNVYELMLKPALSVDAEMNIKYAIRLMTRYNLTHCLVLHGRELTGVVTLNEMTLCYVNA